MKLSLGEVVVVVVVLLVAVVLNIQSSQQSAQLQSLTLLVEVLEGKLQSRFDQIAAAQTKESVVPIVVPAPAVAPVVNSLPAVEKAPEYEMGSPEERKFLEDLMYKSTKRPIHKWNGFPMVYHRHFGKYRGKKVKILELGVFDGGSLEMWARYFGPGADVWGADIDGRVAAYEGTYAPDVNKQIHVRVGGQTDFPFLDRLVAEAGGSFDIILDDAGHFNDMMIASFQYLYKYITPGGVYLVEDTHTSYLSSFSGGLNRKGTFMEFAKETVDKVNAWHCNKLPIDEFTNETDSMHFYDSIVVFEKKYKFFYGEMPAAPYRIEGETKFINPVAFRFSEQCE